MVTLKVDSRRRVVIPDAEPGKVFSYESDSNGTIHLVPVKADAPEPFPRGSLSKYLTPERDKEQLGRLHATLSTP